MNSSYVNTAITIGAFTAVGAIALPVTVYAIGFTSAGIAAGSLAASIQGSAVAKASLFALTQSAAAKGIIVAAGTKLGLAAGVGTGAISRAYHYFNN